MAETTNELDMTQEFTLTRVLDAPRDLVWHAWTAPDELTHWLHPRGLSSPRDRIDVDLRVGGRYSYVMIEDETGQEHLTGGVYLELAEPERLVFTWGNPDDPVDASSVITVTLAERGDRTDMTFNLRGFPGYAGDGNVYDGWASALDILGEHLGEGRARGGDGGAA